MTRRVLHAGCGGSPLPPYFGDDPEEVRLDIDPGKDPDIVASLTDLGEIGRFGVVYTSHTLEHLYPHEVPIALREFRRVLSPGGHALIFVPDLEGLTISEDVLFETPAGPITALDLIYGYGPMVEDSPYMAHHTGFTSRSLEAALYEAGFSRVATQRLRNAYNLMAAAQK